MHAQTLCPPAGADGPALPRVAVVGEALVDRFDEFDLAGGAPFNLARSLSAFGVPVTLVTRVGDADDGADCVRDSACRFGLEEAGIQRDAARPTGVATVKRQGDDHRFQIASEAAWDAIELEPARRLLRERQPSVLCFGTLAQRSPISRDTVHALLDETTALRFLDVNLRPGQDNRPLVATAMAAADWVKMNEDELGHLIIWFAPQCDPSAPSGSAGRRNAIQHLIERFALDRMIVTRGARGYEAWDHRGRCVASADGVALPNVTDSVGAGDAFSAALVALHLAGRSFAQSLSAANRFAAGVCAERGAVPDDDEFFRAWRWTLGLHRPHATSA